MKKYLVIVVMALLVLASCGKKEDAKVSGDEKSDTVSSETKDNPYFLQDSIYVPVKITFSDSVITNEFNDKGWLVRTEDKGSDYGFVEELSYIEDGNTVVATVKSTYTEADKEPEIEESKWIIFNDDGTTDKYESGDFGTAEVTKRDYKGRAVSIVYSEKDLVYGDYSNIIDYSAEAVSVEQKDADNNPGEILLYKNIHMPLFAAQVVYLPARVNPYEVKISSNGLVTEDPSNKIKFSYNESRRIVSVREGEEIISSFDYDDNGKLVSINNSDKSSDFKSEDGDDGCDFEFKYDENGNISEITIQCEDESPETIKIKYEKVPASIAGLCSYWRAEDSLVPYLIDNDFSWNVPYECFIFELN